ncbi:MAG: diguanylate cyclase [Campylobacterales bacterium]|nr:diguanylate cyclase [Campylobacterales bacterium]
MIAIPEPIHYLQKELHSFIKKPLFDFIEKSSLYGIWYWDLNKKENMWISPHFLHMLGYRQDEIEHLSSEWKHLLFEEDYKVAIENLNKHLKYPEYPFDKVLRYLHKGGSTIALRCRAMVIRNKENKPLRIIAFHNDVTHAMQPKEDEIQAYKDEIKKLREEIQQKSFYDTITQLYNRQGLEESYKYLIEVAKRSSALFSVAMVHLEKCGEVQVQHGQERFDKVLKDLTTILIHSTRRVDILGRFGEEEFIILMPNTNKKGAITVCERIRQYVQEQPLAKIDYLSISCGVATMSLNVSDNTQKIYDTLNLFIDEALYHAQKNGGNQVLHYDDINTPMDAFQKESSKEKNLGDEDFYL